MKKLSLPPISLETVKAWINSLDRRTLIQNGIAVGAFLVFLLFFFFPVLVHNGKLVSQVNQLKNQVAQANAKIARIPAMTKQKELFGTRAEEVRRRFFEAKEADQLIEIISTTAGEAGVKISASRPAKKLLALPTPFDQMYSSTSYELLVEGPYHNLGTLINAFERYPKSFAVHELEIAANDQAPMVHQCTLALVAFIKRAAMAQPPAPPPVQ